MPIDNCTSIIRLDPTNFTFNLWGGDWIPRLKRTPIPDEPVGESWEFSGHSLHPSHLKFKDGSPTTLPELIRLSPPKILGGSHVKQPTKPVPFLVKFIDARDDLSVQVHPSLSYARSHERDSGKSESWVILGCGHRRDEGFIYLGFNPILARQFKNLDAFRSSFRRALAAANQRGPHLNSAVRREAASFILPYLNRVRVQRGDIYHVPAGTIHAIGKGVQLFEVQQTSDITYRVWDWNRPDPNTSTATQLKSRVLHLKKAFDVLDFVPRSADEYMRSPKPIPIKHIGEARQENLIVEPSAGYAADRIVLAEMGAEVINTTQNRFAVLTVIEGDVAIFAESRSAEKEWRRVRTGQTVLIPAFVNRVHIQNEVKKSTLIKCYAPR